MPESSSPMPQFPKHARTLSKLAAVTFIAVLVFFSLQAVADDDPPDRVARVSYLSGDVSMQPGGVDDWTGAKLNRPLTSGDRLWTARDARAELQIGNASLRLNDETSFTLSHLDDGRVQVQVAQGSLNVRVRKLYENETFEISTPNFTVSLLRAGEYRIDVNNDADVSIMTVWSGSAQVEGGGQSVTVHPRQQVTFRDATHPTYDVASAPGPDSFDEWCQTRIAREDRAVSARYTSRDVIGYEDLDDYGTWRVYSSYGRVWVPASVVAGWAPYRYGHWEWIYPWGWTWIDDAPWGFAPFHYGRWVYAPFGWAWVPGPVYVRPVYAPALVAWIGGRNWGVGLSFGGGWGYGWLPLGPREPFIPWYRGSRNYWSRVNVHNTYINNTYITNIYNNYNCRGRCGDQTTITHIRYANRAVPNGVTVVDRDTLVRSRPVGHNAMRVNSDVIRKAPVMARLDETPSRENVLGGRNEGRVNRPPERAFARPVITKGNSPKPVPFDRQVRMFSGTERNSDSPSRNVVPRPGTARDMSAGRPDLVEARERVPKPPDANRGATEPGDTHGVEDRGNAAIKRQVPRPPDRGRMGLGAGTEARGEEGGRRAADARPGREVPKPPEGFRPESNASGSERHGDSGSLKRPDRGGANDIGVPRPEGRESPRSTPPRSMDRGAMDVNHGVRGVRPDGGVGGVRSPEVRSEPRVWRSAGAGGGRGAEGSREMRGAPQRAPTGVGPAMRQAPSGSSGGAARPEGSPRGGGGGSVRNNPGRG